MRSRPPTARTACHARANRSARAAAFRREERMSRSDGFVALLAEIKRATIHSTWRTGSPGRCCSTRCRHPHHQKRRHRLVRTHPPRQARQQGIARRRQRLSLRSSQRPPPPPHRAAPPIVRARGKCEHCSSGVALENDRSLTSPPPSPPPFPPPRLGPRWSRALRARGWPVGAPPATRGLLRSAWPALLSLPPRAPCLCPRQRGTRALLRLGAEDRV